MNAATGVAPSTMISFVSESEQPVVTSETVYVMAIGPDKPAGSKLLPVIPEPDHVPPNNPTTVGSRLIGAADPQTVPGETPVSYTHLRAHETVLDIVCRLLLEKKNTNISYITIT